MLRQRGLRYSSPVPICPTTSCPPAAPGRAALHVCLALPLTPRAWELSADDWADDVCLVVTELVTNAVRHAGGRLALEVWFTGGRVTVAVADDACRVPQPRASTDDDESGRGMLIVAALAGDWGVDARPDGKRVWACFAPPTSPLHAEPDCRTRG